MPFCPDLCACLSFFVGAVVVVVTAYVWNLWIDCAETSIVKKKKKSSLRFSNRKTTLLPNGCEHESKEKHSKFYQRKNIYDAFRTNWYFYFLIFGLCQEHTTLSNNKKWTTKKLQSNLGACNTVSLNWIVGERREKKNTKNGKWCKKQQQRKTELLSGKIEMWKLNMIPSFLSWLMPFHMWNRTAVHRLHQNSLVCARLKT